MLFKKNRIQESLGLILTEWTPDLIVEAWGLDGLEFCPSKVIKVNRDGLRALPIWHRKKQTDSLPCSHYTPLASTSSVLSTFSGQFHTFLEFLARALPRESGIWCKGKRCSMIWLFLFSLEGGLEKILVTIFQWLRTIWLVTGEIRQTSLRVSTCYEYGLHCTIDDSHTHYVLLYMTHYTSHVALSKKGNTSGITYNCCCAPANGLWRIWERAIEMWDNMELGVGQKCIGSMPGRSN